MKIFCVELYGFDMKYR